MSKQKSFLAIGSKYLKIIFFALWLIGIFVGGKFMYSLVTIFALYMVITFRQTGRDAMEWQKKLHKFLHMKFEITEFNVFFSQIMFLIVGTIIFMAGLANLLS